MKKTTKRRQARATVTIRGINKMTEHEREKLSRWMQLIAFKLELNPSDYSNRFTARWM